MRRIVAFAFIAFATATAAARQGQSPPPPTPTPSPQATPVPAQSGVAVGTGRTGMVVVDRQAATSPRGTGTPERVMITSLLSPGPTSWQNVKMDVRISDSLNTDTEHSKTVTVLCLDGNSGQVRSQSGEGLINIDTRPSIRPDGRIYVQLILEYRPDFPGQPGAAAATPSRAGVFSESLNLIVMDAKPMIASQSADPRSDRKVMVEVTATVVK
jgi:hypothetical protein